jgi:hypothetical protein
MTKAGPFPRNPCFGYGDEGGALGGNQWQTTTSERTPEGVAWKLYQRLESADENNRKIALDLFAERLEAVQNPAQRLKASPEQTDLFAGRDLSALSEAELKKLKKLMEKTDRRTNVVIRSEGTRDSDH